MRYWSCSQACTAVRKESHSRVVILCRFSMIWGPRVPVRMGSFSRYVMAETRSPGRVSIFALFRSLGVISYMFLSVLAGGSILFLIPSRPAASMQAKVRYGLHMGSGDLNSARVLFPLAAGTRMRAERFVTDQLM